MAVKIDPFFANMAQRLEETLRRPIAPTPPQPPASSATAPGSPSASGSPPASASNAVEIERVIDLALGLPAEPAKAAASAVNGEAPRAPEVVPPTRDDLEAEMANLLGRSHR